MKAQFPLGLSRRFRLAAAARIVLVSAVVGTGLAACGGANIDSRPYEKNSDGTWGRGGDENRDTVFGKGGLNLFGGKSKEGEEGGGSGVAVNAYLWRAALDTLSFMPLVSADPFGGVIITDWYAPPEGQGERFKANVYILGRALRADGVRVSVFRQVQDGSGQWADAPVTKSVGPELEDAILTRARQLRMASSKD